MRLLAASLACLALLSVAAAQSPRVLIVQAREPAKDGADLNVAVSDYLAQEIDGGSLLTSVVWGLADPIFREAALAGRLGSQPDQPSLDQAFGVAERLGAQYTVWLKATRSLDKVTGNIRLFKGRREIWKDAQTLNVSLAGQASEADSARSIARTWASLMASKPLRDLKPIPKNPTEDLQPGQAPPDVKPPVVAPDPVGPVATDLAALRKDVGSLLTSGRRGEAILRLRDAADIDPLNPEVRQLLIETLLPVDPATAAAEAGRVAEMMPEVPGLRVVCARAWMQAGEPEKAREALNESVARDPDGAMTRLLLAELDLAKGQPETALDHAEVAVKSQPSAESHAMRALCRALIGGAEGAEADLAEAKQLGLADQPEVSLRVYALSATRLDAASARALDETKTLFERTLVKRTDPKVRDEHERLTRQAAARAALMAAWTPPIGRRPSHERRLLGLRLLSQALGDLQRFMADGNEDALVDGRLNLGEAIKHAKAAADAYRAENATP